MFINESDLRRLDQQYNWHPCSQMKDYEQFPPLVVKRACGSYIELHDGRRLIDAVSSWWCKSLGHNHPALKTAMQAQMAEFEHVMFANTTYQSIVQLSQRLSQLCPGLDKVFYAGDGSCAVEIAMKMSLHSRQIMGQSQRKQFVALQNGYHGETAAALSVSDVGLYRDAYDALLFDPILIEPVYVSGKSDPLWHDCSHLWAGIQSQLDACKDRVTAIIVEPIVQGAGGMKIYSADFLSQIAKFAKANDIHLIADEIMTGIGRAGKWLACAHAQVQPDFVCISKGLTSGWVPLSTVLTTPSIYDVFYDDYERGKSFLHSHTYSGNALGVAVALATLQVMEQESILSHVDALQATMYDQLENIAKQTGRLTSLRGIGGVVAADLVNEAQVPRLGYRVFQAAVERGALLRPLGDTLYWLPPLNASLEEVEILADITLQSIRDIL